MFINIHYYCVKIYQWHMQYIKLPNPQCSLDKKDDKLYKSTLKNHQKTLKDNYSYINWLFIRKIIMDNMKDNLYQQNQNMLNITCYTKHIFLKQFLNINQRCIRLFCIMIIIKPKDLNKQYNLQLMPHSIKNNYCYTQCMCYQKHFQNIYQGRFYNKNYCTKNSQAHILCIKYQMSIINIPMDILIQFIYY